MGWDDAIGGIIVIVIVGIGILVSNYVVTPILTWIDTVPFGGTIGIAVSWDGWFWISLALVVAVIVSLGYLLGGDES